MPFLCLCDTPNNYVMTRQPIDFYRCKKSPIRRARIVNESKVFLTPIYAYPLSKPLLVNVTTKLQYIAESIGSSTGKELPNVSHPPAALGYSLYPINLLL